MIRWSESDSRWLGIRYTEKFGYISCCYADELTSNFRVLPWYFFLSFTHSNNGSSIAEYMLYKTSYPRLSNAASDRSDLPTYTLSLLAIPASTFNPNHIWDSYASYLCHLKLCWIS